ncbi:helix-turn-helix domain-containing protein [Gemmata sp.]|uniref:helix-turn-helix domain-containing protein n=1 Tax=Gemmata sp. TaxID=1914242 RepID=UPI003F70116F
MATRVPLTFRDDDRSTLATERYRHPDPRVQQRMEVLWLLSQGQTQARAGQLAGVSKATVERYVALFRKSGLPGLREFLWVKPISVLEKHRTALEPEFRKRPPHTVAEAIQRIEALTGVCRKETQVRAFLKKVLG